jgi:hypothetical protein
MELPVAGSTEVEWQTLHLLSSTFATPPRSALPSLLDDPQPLINAAIDIALNNSILNFLILIAFLLLLGC